MATIEQTEYTYPSKDPHITTITAKEISTATIDVDSIVLNGTRADDITSDPHLRSIRALVTSLALNDATKELTLKIEALDPNNILYQDNSAISLPLVDMYFSETDWEWSGWEITDGHQATFTGSTKGNIFNLLKIKNHPFTRTGDYFVSVQVSSLDSGMLVAYDETDQEISKTTIPGVWEFVYSPATPDTATLKFIAKDVLTSEIIHIASIGVYHVTARLEQYLQYLVPTVFSAGSGYVTGEELSRALDEVVLSVQDKFDQLPSFELLSSLGGHVLDRASNPHGITPEMIDAAPAVHTHTLSSLGAAAADHTHNPHDINAAEIDHTHPLASLGAAAVDHVHDLSELGAAPIEHEHPQYALASDVAEAIEDSRQSLTQPRMSQYGGYYIRQAEGYFPALEIPRPLLLPTQLIHRFHQPWDPICGSAYSDTPRILDTSAWSAFYAPFKGDITPYYATYDRVPVVLGYRFHLARAIVSYTISRRIDDATTYPTAWTLKDETGSILDSQTVSWSSGELSKTFTLDGTHTVSELIWTITEISYTEEESVIWGVHLDVTYGPVDSSDTASSSSRLASIADTEARYTTVDDQGKMRSLTLSPDDIYYTGESWRYDQLYIYAQKSGTHIDYGYDLCPPEYGYKRSGIALFANYRPSRDRSRYGTLSTTASLAEDSDVEYLYTHPTAYDYTINTDQSTIDEQGVFTPKPLDTVITSTGTTTLIVDHTDIPHLHLYGWKLVLDPNDYLDAATPTHLQILYTRTLTDYYDESLPAVDEYGYTVISGTIDTEAHVCTYTATCIDADIVPQYVDKEHDWSHYDTSHGGILPTTVPEVESLRYIFTNTAPDATHIAIVGVQPLFTGDFFDVKSNILYDAIGTIQSHKSHIGIVCRQVLNDDSTVWYPYVTPLGTEVVIPLDVSLGDGDAEVTIPNPFYSTHISISPTDNNMYHYSGSINRQKYVSLSITPSIRIKEITPEKISMIVQDGLRGIVIRRLW